MLFVRDDGGAILRVALVVSGVSVAVGLVPLVLAGASGLARGLGIAAVAGGALLALVTVPFYTLREGVRAGRGKTSESQARSAPILVRCRTCGVTDVRYRYRCWNCGHRL